MAPDGMGMLEKLPSPLVLPLHQLDLPLTVSFSHLRVIFSSTSCRREAAQFS